MFWTDSKDWKRIAETIRHERMVNMTNTGRNPLDSDIGVMFANIQGRFIGKNEISLEERKAICELLFEIYLELNTLKPMGRNYKTCFNSRLVDSFIETIKMANDNNGQSFTTYFPSIISWLEDYKKTMSVNMINNIRASDNAR